MLNRNLALIGILIAGAASSQIFRYTQTESSTARYDAQRTGWIRVDHFIAPDKMNGFALQWKTKLVNTPRNGAALGSGIVGGGGLGITLAWLGLSDNRTVAIDMDNGFPFFNRAYGPATSTGSCLSASLATPTRTTTLVPAESPKPTLAGQSTTGPNAQLPFGSVLGNPGEGIPPVKPGSYFAAPGTFFAAPGAKPYDGTPDSAIAGAAYAASGGQTAGRGPANLDGGGPGRGPGRGRGGFGAFGAVSAVYTVSNDGMLRRITIHDGLDGNQPVPFLPAGAQATDLTLINNLVYTATVNGCGGAPNGVWSINSNAVPAGLPFPKPTSWLTGGTASPHTPAFNADGLLYVTVSSGTGPFADSVVALDPATLAVKGTFTMAGANFASPAVILRQGSKDLIAAQAADGRIFLLDGANLATPLATSAAVPNLGNYKPNGLAAWQDPTGQAWLLSTTSASVVAHKITPTSITQVWTLPNVKAPLAPLVINGVVFALAGGDQKAPAVLHAVNGLTGQSIWNSGKAITSFVPQSSALWNSMGQVLVGAYDGTLYAFGVNLERHL